MKKEYKLFLVRVLVCFTIILYWKANEVIKMQREQIRELTVMNEKLMNSNEVIAGKLNEFIQGS